MSDRARLLEEFVYDMRHALRQLLRNPFVSAGTAAALMLTRLMSSLLFRVNAFDPLSLGVVTLLLAGVAALACLLPARRVMRVDPMVALRFE